jgi:hypothetical protein
MLDWLLHHASRATFKALSGRDVSWCAHAFENRHRPFWRLWVKVWGEAHCRDSADRYK